MSKRSNYWHSMSSEDVLRAFSSNRIRGLSSRDAMARRLKNAGNVLWSTDLSDRYPSVLHQLCDYTTVLFVLAVFLSALFHGVAETVSIALLLCLSVSLRAVVFILAQNVYHRNARYMFPRCRVLRDGRGVYLFADQVVEGDILLFSPGDTVPGDVRLISGTLSVSEVYFDKHRCRVGKNASDILSRDTIWAERSNILYAASTVLSGSGIGVVVSVGERTLAYAQKGRIPLPKEEKSTLLSHITGTSRLVSLCMMIVCSAYLLIGLFQEGNFVAADALFLSSIALIVASVGEMFSVSLHAACAGTLQCMREENSCVVKSSSSIEKIARTEWLLIGSEKLLSSGEMFIHSWYDGQLHSLTDSFPTGLMNICTNVASCFPEGELLMTVENREECSGAKHLLLALQKNHSWPNVRCGGSCLQTTVCNKLQTSLVSENDHLYAYVCGSADDVIGCCSKIMTQNGPRAITSEDVAALRAYSHDCATHARHTIAVAKRISPMNHLERPATVQNSMIFLGCLAVTDTVDPDVRDLVEQCRRGGIRIALLCDDTLAARYMASCTGILTDVDAIVSCREEEIVKHLSGASTGNLLIQDAAQHKTDVIHMIKQHTHNVLFVGDGLSDLPAVRACLSFAAEKDKEHILDALSAKADAVLECDPRIKGNSGHSATRIALQAIACCRSTVINLRWVVTYLLISQVLRAVLALFCVCLQFPLITSSHILFMGCVVDFIAAMHIAVHRETTAALSIAPARIQLPGWKSGIMAAVGIGVLGGLLVSLTLFVMTRVFCLFGDASVSMMRLLSVTCTATVSMYLCRESVPGGASRPGGRNRMVGLLSAILPLLFIAFVLYSVTILLITDWRIWLISLVPAAIIGGMLYIYRRTQEN